MGTHNEFEFTGAQKRALGELITRTGRTRELGDDEKDLQTKVAGTVTRFSVDEAQAAYDILMENLGDLDEVANDLLTEIEGSFSLN